MVDPGLNLGRGRQEGALVEYVDKPQQVHSSTWLIYINDKCLLYRH